ncbi:RNase A-like domain-containing protein [Streptomyces sp. NBC_01361]|uniref:RNase A-like domain-containing protein n=1 Tax=Streptomyces sp. NBC_01361 TaxID=2903838 RepID=UPI002E30CDDD|nr:RNase A-like domain-containing protein [Streptomyces sp. NBC_01361]
MGTPAPSSGTIDVKPSTLHQVAGGFAGEQTPFDKAAKNLIKELKEYPDAGGYGTAPQAFAASYLKAANRYLEVWAKAVVSIGGAAVGFATTANNYSKAEAANDASGKTKPQTQPPPVVIDKVPDYGSVPDLKWGDDDGGDDFIRSLLECIPDVVWHLIRPLLEHAFRWGKVAEVYPYPQQHYLNSLSQSWADMTKALSWAEDGLTRQMYGITQQSNSEWHDAMRQFCSSLWGTTAWGKQTASYEWKHDSAANQKPSHPVMTVLFDTAMKISDLLREFAEAAVYVNGEVWDIYFDAVKKAVGDIDLSDGVDLKDLKEGAKGVGRFLKGLAKGGAELSVEITLNIDTAALNRVVEEYNRRVNALWPRLDALMEALDEAYRSAPTYAAEEARAEAFGARSLNDYKKEHHFTVPGQDPDNMFYPLDLANQEGLYDSHPIDKHVGLTDDQLRMRLRDQAGAPAASTFKDLASAQKFTTAAIEDINNADRIAKWIEGVEKKIQNNPNYDPNKSEIKPEIYKEFAGQSTGRSVSRADYDIGGMSAKADDKSWVQVRLIYKEGLHPPFIVLTAMPHKGP